MTVNLNKMQLEIYLVKREWYYPLQGPNWPHCQTIAFTKENFDKLFFLAITSFILKP